MSDETVRGRDPGAGDTAHASHDAERIAALLDRDLPDPDRRSAMALVKSCAGCNALFDDLRSMAIATSEMPTPVRRRDFTLTPEAATRLRAAASGEPTPVPARLMEEMTLSTPRHAAHDRLLIASLVDRSITTIERARAEEQMAACPACAQLHRELVALAAATRAMPVPSRPRDYTLSLADAERLRVSGWRRLIAAIGSSRDVFSRPLAIGFTTLGLAGLLVATVPVPFGTGGATSADRLSSVGAPVEDGNAGSGLEEFSAAASAAPAPAGAPEASGPAIAASEPSPEPSVGAEAAPALPAGTPEDAPDVLFQGGESSPLPGEPESRDLYQAVIDDATFSPSPMAIVAALLLVAGLGLFGLRWTARRLGDG